MRTQAQSARLQGHAVVVHTVVVAAFVVASILPIHAFAAQPAPAPSQSASGALAQAANDYGKLPLSFEANRGQADPQVKYISRGKGYSLFLTDREAVLSLTKSSIKHPAKPETPAESDILRMKVIGASSDARIAAADQLPGTANYFIGKDPAKWHSNVPTYSRVKYTGVYPGIDLVYYGNQRQLEYDFVVAPGANPSAIRLQLAGARHLALGSNGDLTVSTANGEIAFRKPVLYQVEDGKRQPVEGRFVQLANNSVGFSIGRYNRAKELVIDPILSYSTFLSGAGAYTDTGEGTQIVVDAAGDAYITGNTSVIDFPTTKGSYQPTVNGSEVDATSNYVFVAKLNPAGTALIYATYLGGNDDSETFGNTASSIFVDAAGSAYVTGTTYSLNFPVTPGAFQSVSNNSGYRGYNGFLTKLNPAGSALVYSTYLGGSGGDFEDSVVGDQCAQVAVNSAGNAFVTGVTTSNNFPVTPGAFQLTNKSFFSAFVTEFNTTGTGLVYSSYLGGTIADVGTSIAVDAESNAYIAGYTRSKDFPVTAKGYQQINKSQIANGEATAFIAKMNPAGSALIYATFLGGSGGKSDSGPSEQPTGIAVDSAGDAYVTGTTASSDFPVSSSAYQKTNKSVGNYSNNRNTTGFITKLNPTGSALIFSTYLGSSAYEVPSTGSGAIALDSAGNAYVTGTTYGSDFPVSSNALQLKNLASANYEAPNAFVTEMSSVGKLVYSSYLGGSNMDFGSSIAVDSNDNVYVTGTTQSADFPVTPGALITSAYTKSEAFVSKFNLTASAASASLTTLISSANPTSAKDYVIFTASVRGTSNDEIPTGTIKFTVGGVSSSVALDATGHATYSTQTLTDGIYSVVATYSGDKNFSSSSDKLSETIVGPAASITLLSGSGQTVIQNQPAPNQLVFVVKDAKGTPVPGAYVYFSQGNGITYSGNDGVTGFNGQASVAAIPTITGTITGSASVAGVTAAAFFTFKVIPITATPRITPFSGTYLSPQTVTITDNTAGVVIHYTIDGSDPGPSSPIYSKPFVVSQTTTVKAYAVLSGDGASFFTSTTYVIPPPVATPVILPAGGASTGAQTVEIADATPGATIYYTSNGTVPTTSSPVYTAPFVVSQAATVQALAVAANVPNSAVASAQFTMPIAVNAANSIITTAGGIAGEYGNTGDGGPFSQAWINSPGGVAMDGQGNLYILELYNYDVRKVNAQTGIITLVAGNGTKGRSGDNGPATKAEFNIPQALAVDAAGDVFIGDTGNNVVRKVNVTTGVITTVAGTGTSGYTGDGGLATKAEISTPRGLAVDAAGNLFIADNYYGVIRRVDAKTGIITTFAGSSDGYSGDGGAATKAQLLFPYNLATDAAGDLYIADSGNNVVRKVTASTGMITTVAGHCVVQSNGRCSSGYSGDGGKATSAELNSPFGLAVDSVGNLFIADGNNNVIRKVNAAGTISTVAGSSAGTGGYTGDGGSPLKAELDGPNGVVVAPDGVLFISEYDYAIVRKVTPATGAETPAPAYNLEPGTYAAAQKVTLTDAAPGVTIYYTTNGTAPTTSSTKYTGPITVSATETIQAIAKGASTAVSSIVTAKYTID